MARISEALVATAIGILIAIPAVAAFNAFQRVVRGTLANTDALGHLLLAHLKATPLAERSRRRAGRVEGRAPASAAAAQGREDERRGTEPMAGGASQEADEAITGINVTPLVDITLVLLIIFMVTTKIVMNSDGAARPAEGGDGHERRAGRLQHHRWRPTGGRWSTASTSRTTTRSCRSRATRRSAHPDLRAVIKADAAVTHGRVIHVLDLLKQAHVNKIAFGVTPSAAAGTEAEGTAMMARKATRRTQENGTNGADARAHAFAVSAMPTTTR